MFFEILELCSSVKDLYEKQESEEFIFRPKLTAIDTFKVVVIRAYTYIGKAPITANVTSDGMEGLNVEWIMPSGDYVKYHIADNGNGTLSYHAEDEFGTVANPNYMTLVRHLQTM